MSKRLGVRVALAIAALAATTLLQGCGDDDLVFGAWAPIGSFPIPGFYAGFSDGAASAPASSTGGTAVTAGTP